MNARRTSSRVIGALFLGGFLFYGGGFGLVTSVIETPDFLAQMALHETALLAGAVLMLVNIALDVGKGVLFFPIVEPYGRRTALTYLSAIIVQVVLLAVGGLFLLMLVPLGQAIAGADPATVARAQELGNVLIAGNEMAYHIGQASLSVGGAFLSALLYRTALIPRLLAGLGVFGYAMHFIGSVAELLGIPIGLILLIPGGLFELALAFWLLLKGIDEGD